MSEITDTNKTYVFRNYSPPGHLPSEIAAAYIKSTSIDFKQLLAPLERADLASDDTLTSLSETIPTMTGRGVPNIRDEPECEKCTTMARGTSNGSESTRTAKALVVTRGCWIKDKAPTYSCGHQMATIRIPSRCHPESHEDGTINHQDNEVRSEEALDSFKLTSRSKRTHVQPTFRFLDLPAEIRVAIYQLLIPTGSVFHIAPISNHYVAITHVSSCTSERPTSVDTCLPRVNKQLKHECYSLLYGENTFVYRVESPKMVRMTRSIGSNFESWTRIFNVSARPPWPIAAGTVSYMRYLGVVVTLAVPARSDDYRRLQRYVKDIVDLIRDHHTLKRLELALGFQVRSLSRRCSQPTPTPLSNLQATIETTSIGNLSIGIYDSALRAELRAEESQYILEPFAQLHKIETVSVTGLVEEPFAAKLASCMTSEQNVQLQLSPRYGLMKSLERRKGGRAKRRRGTPAVVKYWEPQYVWSAAITDQGKEAAADYNEQGPAV